MFAKKLLVTLTVLLSIASLSLSAQNNKLDTAYLNSVNVYQLKEYIAARQGKTFMRPKLMKTGDVQVRLRLGVNMSNPEIQDPTSSYYTYSYGDFTGGIGFRKFLSSNTFMQADVDLIDDWESMYSYYSYSSSSYSYPGLYVSQIKLTTGAAVGFRVANLNGLQIVDLAMGAGVSTSLNSNQVGESSTYYGVDYFTGDTLYQSYSSVDVTNKYVPYIYIGLGKDFRIAKWLSLTFDYKFRYDLRDQVSAFILIQDYDTKDINEARLIAGTNNHKFEFGLSFDIEGFR